MVIKNIPRQSLGYYLNLPYTIILERWDDAKNPYWVARVAELPHCMIHGDTPEEAIKEIEEVKKDWITSNLKRGLNIPEPSPRKYSGKMILRISPTLHKLLAHRAEVEGMSLNQYMSTALATSVGLSIEHNRNRKAEKTSGS
jgi:predicted HicB family RNase H-like nuclease